MCYVEGEVLKVGYKRPYKERYYARLTEINGERVDANAVIEFDGETELDVGDIFSMRGVGEAFGEYEKYLISDGYIVKIVSDNVRNVAVLGKSERKILH